jgi:UDPglucose 6-dehydrogenase
MELVADPLSALTDASALLVVTEWREFRSPDFDAMRAVMRTPVLFDGRNLYDPALMRTMGFEYIGIGRPSVAAAQTDTAHPTEQAMAA